MDRGAPINASHIFIFGSIRVSLSRVPDVTICLRSSPECIFDIPFRKPANSAYEAVRSISSRVFVIVV